MYHQAAGGDRADLERVVEHRAPRDPGRVAEAEEAQRRLGQDRDRDGQRGVGEDHRHHVGQHVLAPSGASARRRAPGRARGRARSLIDSVWLRISSAVPGQEVTPITMTMLTSERPSTRGQHDRQRQERDHQEPLGEPEEDRGRPSPRRSPTPGRSGCRSPSRSAVASSPTSSEIRAPQISRVSTERPFSSVPSEYSADGGLEHRPVGLGHVEPARVGEQRRGQRDARRRRSGCRARSCRCGGCGTVAQPRRQDATPAAPRELPRGEARCGGCRRSCPHPRVEQAVDQVGDQVGEDHARRWRSGTCPAAPRSPGRRSPRWRAARARGSRRRSRR